MTTCTTVDACSAEIEALQATLAASTDIYAWIALAGAAAMGFVLGWTLFFANRGKAGAISAAELGAMAGVIGGGVVLTWVNKDGVMGPALFGAYGVGLLFGFLTYYRLYKSALAGGGSARELESLHAHDGFVAISALETAGGGALDLPRTNPVDVIEALKAARADAHDVLFQVNLALDAMTDSDADKPGLKEAAETLRAYIRLLNDKIIDWSFDNAIVNAFLQELKTQTKALNEEADRMKRASGRLQEVSKLLGSAAGLLGKIQAIA